MLNDGSFQIFTARFRVRNPTGAAVNAITAGRTICTDVYSAEGKASSYRRQARSIGFVSHESAQITRSADQLECPRTQYPQRYNPPVFTANLFLMPYSCISLRTHYKSRRKGGGLDSSCRVQLCSFTGPIHSFNLKL